MSVVAGVPISNEHHVVRHCKGTQIREDGTPSPAAFITDDWDGISCNWVEYFPGNKDARIAQVRTVVAARRSVTGTHRLAMLYVGTARGQIKARLDLAVAVTQNPLPAERDKPADPSHALIEQVEAAFRTSVGEILAECVLESFPAKA